MIVVIIEPFFLTGTLFCLPDDGPALLLLRSLSLPISSVDYRRHGNARGYQVATVDFFGYNTFVGLVYALCRRELSGQSEKYSGVVSDPACVDAIFTAAVG